MTKTFVRQTTDVQSATDYVSKLSIGVLATICLTVGIWSFLCLTSAFYTSGLSGVVGGFLKAVGF